jgi:c-di-GMP-binding flagellar brake protein YcgR
MKDIERHYLVQREFVRVPVAIPVEVKCPSKNLGISAEGWVRGLMIEIGGGGARIRVSADLVVGEVLAVRFDMPDTDAEIRLYGRIVDVTDDGANGLCEKFVGISEDQRKTILQYAFREQIRRAKREEGAASSSGGSDGTADN